MSKYTTTIYYLKNNGFDFELNNYPIFDEEYRPILNNLILDKLESLYKLVDVFLSQLSKSIILCLFSLFGENLNKIL